MEENQTNNELEVKKEAGQSPGAAIGSFIVIAILIAGAVYTFGGQIKTKNKVDVLDDSANVASTTLSEEAGLDLIESTTTAEVLLNQDNVDSLLN